MTALHEAEVGARFDLCERRFKSAVGPGDVRLRAILGCLGPLPGLRVLDLGCGKGRFARRLAEAGAEVIGIDLSAAMLAGGEGIDRVRASGLRLPFADRTFDAIVAVEVLEHVAVPDGLLNEARRVLRAGGALAIVDKNAGALNGRRPWLPALFVKWLDEKRGRWMYPSGGPVRERWFRPSRLAARLRRDFHEVRVEYLLSPSEARHWLFRRVPPARLMVLWSARVPSGGPG